jgi:hypothetical protein
VRVAGLHRLRVLAPNLGRARGLRVWGEDASGASAWQVDLGTARFFLMLSPEVERGFSGEGQVLDALTAGDWEAALPRVRAELNWQAELDPDALARRTGLTPARIEGALAAAFPDLVVRMVDTDSVRERSALRRALEDFRQGRVHVLLGTQMVAKGLDFPGVRLVGIVNADTGAWMPDFRAAERTFSLLVQVSGRAGRRAISRIGSSDV